MIHNCTQGGSLITGILTGNVPLIGRSLDSDIIIEPTRAPLIPGLLTVKAAAKEAGKWPAKLMGVDQRACRMALLTSGTLSNTMGSPDM